MPTIIDGSGSADFQTPLPIAEGGTGSSNGTASININGTIGASTASTGSFTTLLASGTSTLAAVNSGALAVAGSISATGVVGTPTLDTVAAATTLANNATVDFSNSSGMLIANNHAQGSVSIYLVGGGAITLVSSVVATVGAVTYVAGISGYRFTNNYGSSAVFSFMFFRTRPDG